MTTVYNIEYFKEDWVFTKGDTINFFRGILKNGVAYDLTGLQIDIHVKRPDGHVIKKFSTTGGAPEITVAINVLRLYCDGFTESGYFDGDVQVTDGTDVFTIGYVKFVVNKEVTA
jgi:hypothetical protein